MAAVVTHGVRVADWVTFGVHALLWAVCNIHLKHHLTTIKNLSPLTRHMHQKMLNHAMSLQFLSMWSVFFEVLGVFFYDRGDIIVSYSPVIFDVAIYGIFVHMISVYVYHNLGWMESTWYTATVGMLFFLGFSVWPEVAHYAMWAIGVGVMYWVFHLWVSYHRQDKDGPSPVVMFVLIWVGLFWVGIFLVQLFGHMGMMKFSFVIEVWTRNVLKLSGVTLPTMVMAFHLSGYKTRLGMFIEARGLKFMATRCQDHGFLGDYLFTHPLLDAGEAEVLKPSDLVYGDQFVQSMMGSPKGDEKEY